MQLKKKKKSFTNSQQVNTKGIPIKVKTKIRIPEMVNITEHCTRSSRENTKVRIKMNETNTTKEKKYYLGII